MKKIMALEKNWHNFDASRREKSTNDLKACELANEGSRHQ
jgi:hypothetical protein